MYPIAAWSFKYFQQPLIPVAGTVDLAPLLIMVALLTLGAVFLQWYSAHRWQWLRGLILITAVLMLAGGVIATGFQGYAVFRRAGQAMFDEVFAFQLVMLVAVGWAAGRTSWQKFCFFMICFGVWDIFFYIWLWVMVQWPESLLTWDLLFFVPLPWVGPVITPVLIALAMAVAGSLIIYYEQGGYTIYWRWFDFLILMGCGLLLIVAFCWDWKNIMRIPGDELHTGIPNPFAWWLYLPVYLFSVLYFALRLRKTVSANRDRLSDEH